MQININVLVHLQKKNKLTVQLVYLPVINFDE